MFCALKNVGGPELFPFLLKIRKSPRSSDWGNERDWLSSSRTLLWTDKSIVSLYRLNSQPIFVHGCHLVSGAHFIGISDLQTRSSQGNGPARNRRSPIRRETYLWTELLLSAQIPQEKVDQLPQLNLCRTVENPVVLIGQSSTAIHKAAQVAECPNCLSGVACQKRLLNIVQTAKDGVPLALRIAGISKNTEVQRHNCSTQYVRIRSVKKAITVAIRRPRVGPSGDFLVVWQAIVVTIGV